MYPIDRRKQALHIYSLVRSIRKAALLLQVSKSTVHESHRWVYHPDRKLYNRNVPSKCNKVVESIRIMLLNDPFLSIRKLRTIILQSLGITISTELIRTAIKKCGLTSKKARYFSQPVDLQEKTNNFLERRSDLVKEERFFVSLDETSFGRNGINAKGYSPRGSKLLIKKQQPRMSTVSAMAVVSNSRIIHWEQKQGSYNTESFCKFLEHLILPHGTVFLLDNVRFHHSKLANEVAVRKGWTFLFTPAYSPWFNPIEGVFSIVKRHYYSNQNVISAFDAVEERHLAAFFRSSMTLNQMPCL